MTTYPWAAGFIAGDRPAVVTGRFSYEDSYTLDRYLATDGYQGGAMAASVKDGMTIIGYRFRAKNGLRGAYDGGFGGVLCQVP